MGHAYAINGAANMQKDLMQNGPIQVGFLVYRSFMLYRSGIYHKHPKEPEEGGHAVKIVGCGVEGHGKFSSIGPSLTVGTPFGVRTASSALSVAETSVASRPWARLTRASPSRQWRRSLCDGQGAHCPYS